MSEQEMNKLIMKVTENEEYAERIADSKTPDELTALLREMDITISEEEAKDAIAAISGKLDKTELDEEDLELVSGGFWGIIPALKVTAMVLGGVGAAALVTGVALLVMYSRSKR